MKFSIIIPTLNEEEHIGKLIKKLLKKANNEILEIMVVDGGSSDETCRIAEQAGARVLKSPKQGRAAQMNYGADHSSGDILYFLHSDTLPPATFTDDIKAALEAGFPVGCFRYRFDSPKLLLKINAYFTRFDKLWCRGGDQSLFIKRSVFAELGGFRQDYKIMEDFEFIIRVRKKYPFKIIPRDMIVSARKYETNSYLRVQMANFVVFNMLRFGYSQDAMVKMYKRLLDYR